MREAYECNPFSAALPRSGWVPGSGTPLPPLPGPGGPSLIPSILSQIESRPAYSLHRRRSKAVLCVYVCCPNIRQTYHSCHCLLSSPSLPPPSRCIPPPAHHDFPSAGLLILLVSSKEKTPHMPPAFTRRQPVRVFFFQYVAGMRRVDSKTDRQTVRSTPYRVRIYTFTPSFSRSAIYLCANPAWQVPGRQALIFGACGQNGRNLTQTHTRQPATIPG